MTYDYKKDTKDKMDKTVVVFLDRIKGIRTGKASPSLVENLNVVDVHGGHLNLKSMANISAIDAKTLMIKVWDQYNVHSVKKAIADANITPNYTVEGSTVRLVLRDLTEETRKEYVKMARKYTEESRVSIRNIRRDINDMFNKQKKDKQISEDQFRLMLSEVEKITDETIKKIDKALEEKEKELSKI